MKVRELVEQLQGLHPDKDVEVTCVARVIRAGYRTPEEGSRHLCDADVAEVNTRTASCLNPVVLKCIQHRRNEE